MLTPGLQADVVEDLKQSGLLQFATDAGYFDITQTANNWASSDGSLEAAREAAMINSQAAILTADAQSELQHSRKRLHEVLSRPPASSTNSANSSGNRAKRQAKPDPSSAQARGSKGLRHFAMSVCNKIEQKKRTSYQEVADELVEELKDSPCESGGDEKNIRRRVYDAFNVLVAVGIIAKEGKKEITWRGFPHAARNTGAEAAVAERKRLAEAVEKKQNQLKELLDQHRMVQQLLQANPVRTEQDTDIALQIPFVLVRAKPEATVEVSVSESMQEVDFKFNAPFSLHDDSYVLKQALEHFGSFQKIHELQQLAPAEYAASS
ncbi:hypothetical protein CEUSTIGMA_g10467.t1 [Chlamydomonas eustigma]|uniref:E2F/DP family winged-helix DNA-binding domain-containing protein n=1 Tax=Chlamydomonas eustigma TaxID=1157962 RepID=A0A250XIX9_9CHLO|nr:hypothetical protein CEUSTIGMA_g10467.t1 [Chlamydomonas eustigma]|eukprot:GAX83041.1 hypothetical protein CEUSTIGMA_g10467.t1 [Chlamydomonas eustigma]